MTVKLWNTVQRLKGIHTKKSCPLIVVYPSEDFGLHEISNTTLSFKKRTLAPAAEEEQTTEDKMRVSKQKIKERLEFNETKFYLLGSCV